MIRFIFISFIFIFLQICPVFSKSLSIIRDAEIEDTIKSYLYPLFKQANLNTEGMNVIIVNDNSVNAFVANGLNVYVNTGLILKSTSANQLVGVLAHETGHVVGGHLARLKETMRIAQRTTLLTSILGGIAAVASQRPDVGVAVMVGSQGSIMGSVSTYRISEENSADKIAVDLLIKTNQSLKGMVDIMKLLDKESRLYPDYKFEYYRTHPITEDRIAFFENMYEKHKDLKVNEEYEKSFSRIKAKLFAFLGDEKRVFDIVKNRNDTDSLYALSIYYLKINDLQKSIKIIDKIISREPKNPFLYELKGQVYFEHGKVKESIAPYKKALSLKPDDNLIVTMLSLAELQEGNKKDLIKISENLSKVVVKEKHDPFIWRIYASCYKKLEDEVKYSYGMAEYNFLVGNNEIALYHANKALKDVLEGTPIWFNLQDIISTVKESNKNKKR